jgi:bifunctional oligoribonuclease and PAP phosphatase NrnA
VTTKPAQAWETNTSPSELARWLADKRSVVILTHAKPDGDAIGSTIAAARALNMAAGGSSDGFGGIASRAECWFAGPMPGWAGAIIASTPFHNIHGPSTPDPAEPDAILIFDTGSWSQLEEFRPWLRTRADRIAVLDHHLKGDPDVAARRIVDPTAAAAAQLSAHLCQSLLRLDSPAGLPPQIAAPLYLGLATDTGWFKHSNVRPATLRLAADLLETGIDHEHLFETVEQRDRPARLRLMARALASLELLADESVAFMSLTTDDFAAARASPGESGGFVDIVRSVQSVRVAALFTEVVSPTEGTVTKVSLRSKGGPAMVDVNKVAAALGGGGHAQAAGVRLTATLADAKALLADKLAEALS